MFTCNGCDTERDDSSFSILIIREWGKGIERFCRECRKPRNYVPDVFFDGKPEINLADGPDGKPRVFSCRTEKDRYLKSKGLQEAGDKVHGAFQSFSHPDRHKRVNSRDEVQKSIQKVKQMGAWNRHQEYLRITREAREAQGK